LLNLMLTDQNMNNESFTREPPAPDGPGFFGPGFLEPSEPRSPTAFGRFFVSVPAKSEIQGCG
jgi:hypothetical protein